MTPKRWIALLAFYISYLLFGASIYYHIEHNLETKRRVEQRLERIEINELLTDHLEPKDENIQNIILEKVSQYCEKPVTNYTLDKYEDPYTWTFYHSLFFAFTVCSTVGYGNLAPSTTLGQMVMIAYSLIGIPINGILLVGLGDFFGRTFSGIYRRYKKYKMSNDDKYVPRQFGLFATVMIALVPGITVFILLPSLLFSYFEGWPYTLSIYYSYVTTSTIGFGDIVPTFQSHQERVFGTKFLFYQIFIIVWFIFSLGYVVMIMTYITKGLRSKKLKELEKQLSINIKATQNRIWHGVTKDVGYLRRILNELYIMKFKPYQKSIEAENPVYNEPGDRYPIDIPRSASCPDLSMYRELAPIVCRKRAFSENYDSQDVKEQLAMGTPLLMRGSSDTDLDKINKQKTFETAQAFMETTDLLAQVVTALANIKPPQDDVRSITSTATGNGMFGGYHGFPDSDILASEWSYPYAENTALPQHYQRARACSDFYLTPRTMPPPNNEWTWSGDNDQIQQVINKRVRTAKKKDDLYKASFASRLDKSTVINMEGTEPRADTKQPSDSKSFLKRLIPFRKKSCPVLPAPELEVKFPPASSYKTISGGQLLSTSEKEKHEIFSANDRRGSLFKGLDRGGATSQQLPQRPKPRSLLDERRPSGIMPQQRRGSYFPAPNRRGSLFTGSGRRTSLFPPQTGRRGSMLSSNDRKGSLFSVPSQEMIDQDVLENTTIADLIRAIEVMHTHATLTELPEPEMPKRKMGTASLCPPELPPLFNLFAQSTPEQQQQPPTNYPRRHTIFNSLTNRSPQQTVIPRKLSNRPSFDPPPYSEKESPKFKRRFSVRPTTLSIPPGKAPPVSSQKSQAVQQSQTALQRRLSLRPSPLAREFLSAEAAAAGSSSRVGPFNRQTPGQSSAGRGASSSTSSSSTFSPLSRIAQIQASRKGSVPDMNPFDIKNKDKDQK